jgi:hypothetical protein
VLSEKPEVKRVKKWLFWSVQMFSYQTSRMQGVRSLVSEVFKEDIARGK